jgi:hypothetical protein
VAFVAAGLMFAGACGGDDDDDGAGSERRSDEASEDARSGADDDATTTASDGAADDDGAVDSPDGGSDSVEAIGEMDFCDGFRAAIRLDSDAAIDGARLLDPPDEIADDWAVFMDFAEASLSTDPADQPEDVEAAGEAAQAATENILDYVGQECGYTVDAVTGEVTDG